MIFQADIAIPANTTEPSPTDVRLPIAKGVITQFSILIPAGHNSLAHLAIFHGAHPIAPSIDKMNIHGDNMVLEWTDHYEFGQPPFELKLLGWNDDDTYEHTFVVYVVMLPKSALLVHAIVDAISKLFRLILPTRIRGGTK